MDSKKDILLDIKKSGFNATDKLVGNIRKISKLLGKNHTVKDIKKLNSDKDVLDNESKKILDEIVNEFKCQERKELKYSLEPEM